MLLDNQPTILVLQQRIGPVGAGAS
jgi:hypothetical protein